MKEKLETHPVQSKSASSPLSLITKAKLKFVMPTYSYYFTTELWKVPRVEQEAALH